MHSYQHHLAACVLAAVSILAVWIRVGNTVDLIRANDEIENAPEGVAIFIPEEPAPTPEEIPVAEDEQPVADEGEEVAIAPSEESPDAETPAAEEPEPTTPSEEPTEEPAEEPVTEPETPAVEEPAPAEKPVAEVPEEPVPEPVVEVTPVEPEPVEEIVPAYAQSRSTLEGAYGMVDWLYTLRPNAPYELISVKKEELKIALLNLAGELESANGGSASEAKSTLCVIRDDINTLRSALAPGLDDKQEALDEDNRVTLDSIKESFDIVRSEWETVNSTSLICN